MFSTTSIRQLRQFFDERQVANFLEQQVTPDIWPDLTNELLCELGVAQNDRQQRFLAWVDENKSLFQITPPTPAFREQVFYSSTSQGLEPSAAVSPVVEFHRRVFAMMDAVSSCEPQPSATSNETFHSLLNESSCSVSSKESAKKTAEEKSNIASVITECTLLRVGAAFDPKLDCLFEALYEQNDSSFPLSTIEQLFFSKTGLFPVDVFGAAWQTRIKADPRFHIAEQRLLLIEKVRRDSATITPIARYNINGLRFADVPASAIGNIYHIAGVCMPCSTCKPSRAPSLGCTYCHNVSHGVYCDQEQKRQRQIARKAPNTVHHLRRVQVVASLVAMNVGTEKSRRAIAHLLHLV